MSSADNTVVPVGNPIVETGRSPRKRGAGRKGRIEKRTSDAPAKAVWPGLNGGQFRPLSEAETALAAAEQDLQACRDRRQRATEARRGLSEA